MGDRAEEIYSSFSPPPSNYEEAIKRFEDYFLPRRNIIYERAKFLKQTQGSDSAEKFITNLHSLAKTCEWGTLNDDMILLVLIIGMNDTNISDKLQLDPALTLEKAITCLRQHEELIRQKQALQEPTISAINKNLSNKMYPKGQNNSTSKKKLENQRKCIRCGYDWHDRLTNCPAINAECNACKLIGHFSKMCKKRKNPANKHVCTVQQEIDSEGEDDVFISEVRTNNNQTTWTQILHVECNGLPLKPIMFKLDTAADVTMIPARLVRDIMSELPIKPPRSQVFSAKNKEQFKVLGTLTLKLRYKNSKITENAYISEEIDVPLLSRGGCQGLNLVKRIYAINTDTDWFQEYTSLFKGLGNLGGEYKIEIKNNAEPYAISAPRAIPISLKNQVKDALDDMLNKGVIVPVDHSTDWCAPMVVTIKKNGGVRICVDLSHLNKNVRRQFHPMPRIELQLAELSGAKYFSKLDANHGFWQLNLARDSQDYTTFITPFGRFKFQKLPFGITSAPEEFQKRMTRALEGAKNCLIHIDDVLVWGNTKEEHDKYLRRVLEKIKKAGITLNKGKTEFCKQKVEFLGFVLSQEGVAPDPNKVKAITEMEPPKDIKEVQRFMGMVTFLAKFIPKRSEIMAPITSLVSLNNAFVWGPSQQIAFERIKDLLTSSSCLTIFDPNKPTIVSCDSSTKGLGAVLLQEEAGVKKPVAYISRTLSTAEKNYANIEREALALTWASDRLKNFLLGKQYTIETDHKPLLQIFKTRNLDDLSPRLQRFRMRMMRYDYNITYTPGKNLFVADALSRKPIPSEDDNELEEEVDAYIHSVVLAGIPTTDENITRVANSQSLDPTCKLLIQYIKEEWPPISELAPEIKPFFTVRNEMSVVDGILLRGSRMIIPNELRHIMLEKLHAGHQGITKTRRRAQSSMWWPGIASDIETKIKSCPICIQHSTNHNEPLLPSKFPDYPWQVASLDLFKLDDKWYLVITDHYSRFFEVYQVGKMRAPDIIKICKTTFARYGIPQLVCSDSGTQFHGIQTSEFQIFAKDWGFSTSSSSPQFHQANGAAEAAVKIAKTLLKKNKDNLALALLTYRNTPLGNGFSPAEMLYGRKLRDNLPSIQHVGVKPPVNLAKAEERYRRQYKIHYDKRHGAKDLSQLQCGEFVWITDLKRHGKIVKVMNQRSYLVQTSMSIVRRNRFNLIPAPYLNQTPEQLTPPEENQQEGVKAKTSAPDPSTESSPLLPDPDHPVQNDTPAKQSTPTRSRLSGQMEDNGRFGGQMTTRSGRTITKPLRYQ
ncbi:uncharacterized protein K02A2.6-like [Cimex lectularius]|uniref:RNA-directed DNA polymerase n=1 Tax=Cimex lectularius TaxID=79782 RepID=A0A8I6S8M1_CIMLE|nr:uncharacterized protein K02A2.6-like [Cimex lectularius]